VLPRMTSDLIDVLEGADPEWSDEAIVNVVLAARGYPTAPDKGDVIAGLARAPADATVFHAGTREEGGKLLVAGGRVLSVVGAGASVGEARRAAYEAVGAVAWPGAQFRADIGL